MTRFRAFTFLGWPLIVIPQLSFYFGLAVNQLALAVNGGVMPVLWNSMNKWDPDPDHVIMTTGTHLKFLCDWIKVNDSGIWSVGDLFTAAGDVLIGPCFWMWVGYVLYRAVSAEIQNPINRS